ncbi:glycosyltransferase family 39 protein [Candidatus Daviesbacteria bacterium]|nr:glycosyltransferase family 39 protein [Candidatus Daviesbacteria bacterium]
MKRKVYIALFLIVIASFFLRFYKVTENPPALNWDEISIGYNAYSILKTGRDEWGKLFPIHFKAYGEYKLPVQVYASIPGIYLFGLNELGVRITPVIYGTLTVLVMFFLGRALFKSQLAGLISAFLLGISPWHIHLTRASFESSLATFMAVLAIWLLIKGFKDQKWFVLSTVPFAVSMFTYNSARIFTPIFLLSVFLIYRKKFLESKKLVLISFLVFMSLLIPLAPYLLSGERSARYKLVSITDDPGLIPRINENRGNSRLPEPFPRLIHNKVTYVTFYFSRNYFSHFTPQFLFFSGVPHKQHHVQNMGELYLFQAPFLFLGLYALFRLRSRFKGLLFAWVLLAFIPVSVTNDSIPHGLRTLIAAPFYQLVSALGLVFSLKWFGKLPIASKVFLGGILTLAVTMSIGYYLYNYYQKYPIAYSRDWQYGYKQVVDYIGKHQDEYDEIIFTRHYGEPHMFTLFYLNYDPTKYQNSPNLNRFETHDWVWVLRFDKYYFPDLGDEGTQFADIVKENPGKKLLFIGRKGDFPKDIPRLFSTNFLNGENAFDIAEVK